MIANFTLSSDNVGFIYATDFRFVDTSSSDVVKRIWDMGDGNFVYNEIDFTHVYNYPGVYNVTLSGFDSSNNSSTQNIELTAKSYVDDFITFSKLPKSYGLAGKPTDTPFVIYLQTFQVDKPLVVNLFAADSKSIPYSQIPSKWNFINPTWRFTTDDLGLNTVENLELSGSPIYLTVDGKTTIVGMSAEASVYYVDSIGSGKPTVDCPLLISATLQTSGFSYPNDSNIYDYNSFANSKVSRAVTVWQVGVSFPNFMRVTGNYIDEIYSRNWTDVKIPTMITLHSYGREYNFGGDIETASQSNIVFTYPETNAIGQLSSIYFALSTSTGMIPISCEDAPLYFTTTDENGFNNNSGYKFTTINSSSAFDTVSIYVSTTINNVSAGTYNFAYPTNLAPNFFVIVPTPDIGSVSKIAYTPQPVSGACPVVDYYRDNGLLIEGTVDKFTVPILSSNNTFNYSISGFSGIYGLAIDPYNFDIIAVDGEQDAIYKFSSYGELLSTLNLSSVFDDNIPSVSGTTPSYISLDKDRNIWVSLYNSLSVLKFDNNLNLLFSITPSEIGIYEDDYLMKPPVVETDRNGDVWVTYSNPNSSTMVKYSSGGLIMHTISLSSNSVPTNIVVDKQNDIWVTESFNSTISGGLIEKYSTNGVLMSSISGINRPVYIALDRDNNPWFSFGVRSFGYVDRLSGNVKTWSLTPVYFNNSNNVRNIITPAFESDFDGMEDEEIGGLAVDVYNRVWVIDAITNNAYIFNADSSFDGVQGLKVINAKRSPNILYYLSDDNTTVDVLSSNYAKSASVTGDWTGNVWYQKYASDSTEFINISGVSVPFSINNFNNSYEIRKVNESFDLAAYMKSLAFPEVLYNNTKMFDEFLPAVVGDAGSSNDNTFEDIGKMLYEKIANFNTNVSDIDTCEISQLQSLAAEIDQSNFTYGVDFPTDIQNMLDLASISKYKLWGNQISGVNVNNIIDWDSPYTTLDRTLSADWYADNGIIETIFNYLLTKNLWVDVQ